MGLICCMSREEATQTDYLNEVKKDLDNRYSSQIKIRSLVNLIPEVKKLREFKTTPTKSIKLPRS